VEGVLFMILGIACFAAMDASGKWVVKNYSVFQLLAVRSSLCLILLAALVPFFGGAKALKTEQPWAHLGRALSSALAFLFFYAALRSLPLADAVAVEFGSPFLVTALAVPLLGERVDAGRWAAVLVGFAGMLLVVKPTAEGVRPEALLAVASSACYAVMMVMTRWISQRTAEAESTFTFVSSIFLVQTIVGLIGGISQWKPMTPLDLALSAGVGVFALGGHLGLTAAFQRAPASVVAPFEYTALLWATLFGLLIYGDFPDLMVWIGVAIIVGAGLYTVRRESATP
jgi:drug/metabolite transporter (DMT)-like permease